MYLVIQTKLVLYQVVERSRNVIIETLLHKSLIVPIGNETIPGSNLEQLEYLLDNLGVLFDELVGRHVKHVVHG